MISSIVTFYSLFRNKIVLLFFSTGNILQGSKFQMYSLVCSEVGSLVSLDAPEFHASSDVREPISLHQDVFKTEQELTPFCTVDDIWGSIFQKGARISFLRRCTNDNFSLYLPC